MNSDVRFSPWVSWASRSTLPDRKNHGVYLIGRFEQQPRDGAADPYEEGTVYIGQSCDQEMQSRWRSFERSAFKNKGKNRGGRRYREQYGGDSSVLYVATVSDEKLMKAFLGLDGFPSLGITASEYRGELADIADLLIKYMERRLILLHAIAQGNRPICNGD